MKMLISFILLLLLGCSAGTKITNGYKISTNNFVFDPGWISLMERAIVLDIDNDFEVNYGDAIDLYYDFNDDGFSEMMSRHVVYGANLKRDLYVHNSVPTIVVCDSDGDFKYDVIFRFFNDDYDPDDMIYIEPIDYVDFMNFYGFKTQDTNNY